MPDYFDQTAFPLEWPESWPRTEAVDRKRARYTVTFDRARRDLHAELSRLDRSNGALAVLSSNVPLRKDGAPYATWRNPEDPGVAVYFVRNGKQHVIACDIWDHIKDNIRAVGLTIEALRTMERTGASGILDRAFSGFEALPAPGSDDDWRSILEVSDDAAIEECERQFRKLAQEAHPDRENGDADRFRRLRWARDKAREELRQ